MIQVHVDTVRGHLTRIGEAHERAVAAAIAAQLASRRPAEPEPPTETRKPDGPGRG